MKFNSYEVNEIVPTAWAHGSKQCQFAECGCGGAVTQPIVIGASCV